MLDYVGAKVILPVSASRQKIETWTLWIWLFLLFFVSVLGTLQLWETNEWYTTKKTTKHTPSSWPDALPTKITICLQVFSWRHFYSICQLFLFFIEFFKLPLRFEQPLLTLLNIVAPLSVMEAEHLALSTCNIHILLTVLALSIKQRQMESTLVAL